MSLILEKIIIVSILAAMVVLFAKAFVVGLDKSERIDCLKWQQQALSLPGFYLTDLEQQQCDAHNIKINYPGHGD